MIIIRLSGGLGNQMFQYALGRALSVRKGRDLLLDTSSFCYAGRRYMLDEFNIQAEEAEVKDLKAVTDKIVEKEYFRYQPEVFRDFSPDEVRWYKGSWQNPNYFKTIYQIWDDFTIKCPSDEYLMIKKHIETYNREVTTVAVHFRRGDFLNKDTALFHGNLGLDYYKAAVEELKQRVGGEGLRLLLFSEDCRYVSCLVTDNVFSVPVLPVFEETVSDAEHLMLMSLCHHNIVANSSFSWWGAALNLNREKCVIAPELWIKGRHYPGIYPKEWVTINNRW